MMPRARARRRACSKIRSTKSKTNFASPPRHDPVLTSGHPVTGQPDFCEKSELSRNRNCAIGATLLILGYSVAFAGDGLFSYFTPDDLMNLYGAWFWPLIEKD